MVKKVNGFYSRSDSYFKKMRKQELIDYIRTIEKNWENSLITNDIQYENCKRLLAEERSNAIDDVMEKAKEIQEEQIKNLEQSPRRNGKRWAIYMNTYLSHIQVACKRLIAEQMKEK